MARLIAEIYPEDTLINVVVYPSQLRGERIVGKKKRKGIIFEGTNTAIEKGIFHCLRSIFHTTLNETYG